MKSVLIFLLFLLIGSAAVMGYHYWGSLTNRVFLNKTSISTHFSLADAPSQSIQGEIASMSGSVEWLSRTATKPVPAKNQQPIMQGEEVTTKDNGQAIIRVRNDSSLLLYSNTHVSIIQLLPQNYVFLQDKGKVHYENALVAPLSVKTYSLVTIMNEAIVLITVDPDSETVAVSVEKGSVREGYQDSQNTSTVVTVDTGQTFVYDATAQQGSIQ